MRRRSSPVLAFGTGSAFLVFSALACSAPLDSDDGPSGPPRFGSPVGNGGGTQPNAPGGYTQPPGLPPVAAAGAGAGSEGGVNPQLQTGDGAGGAGTAGVNAMGGAPSTPGSASGAGGAPQSQGSAGQSAAAGAANGGGAPVVSAGGAPAAPEEPEPPVPFEGRGCDPAVAFFCEDFESLPVGTLPASADFTPSTSNGTLTVDGTFARGVRALRVQTRGNGRAYIALNGFAPPNNSFFARMYVRADAFPTAPDYAHFTLVELAGAGAGLVRPIGGQYIPGQGTLWGAGSDRGPTGDWTNWRPTAPTEPGRFVCIEWEMRAQDNNINVWLDEVAKPELSVSTRNHGGNQVDFVFPQFNSMWIGWELYQGGPTPNEFNLWFDDIVLSTERVGC